MLVNFNKIIGCTSVCGVTDGKVGVGSLDTLGGGEVTYQVLASSCKGGGRGGRSKSAPNNPLPC